MIYELERRYVDFGDFTEEDAQIFRDKLQDFNLANFYIGSDTRDAERMFMLVDDV